MRARSQHSDIEGLHREDSYKGQDGDDQRRDDRVYRRSAVNQNGKRKVVAVVRERNGNSVPTVLRSEGQAHSWIKACVLKGTVLNDHEAASWDGLHGAFEMKRIDHQEAYSLDGACTNFAEEYFS